MESSKRRLADALLTDLGKWSNRELGAGIAALYPEYLALEELLRVLGDANPPEEYWIDPVDQALEKIVARNSPEPQQQLLLAGLVDLLEREPHNKHCGIPERYSWLLPHAAKLAEQIIKASNGGGVRVSCRRTPCD